jgi:hypothetical protein
MLHARHHRSSESVPGPLLADGGTEPLPAFLLQLPATTASYAAI